jgi:uracil-DNA glycosylase family 4
MDLDRFFVITLPMDLDTTWQNYFLWLKERGQSWPIPMDSELAAQFVPTNEPMIPPTVSGFGAPAPSILFVGDAPMNEPEKELMCAMIKAMGLDCDTQAFVADFFEGIQGWPSDPQIESCQKQLATYVNSLNQVRCVVTLGVGGAKVLHGPSVKIANIKSRWIDSATFPNTPTFATYHPRDMLKRPDSKRPAWQDLQTIMRFLNEN